MWRARLEGFGARNCHPAFLRSPHRHPRGFCCIGSAGRLHVDVGEHRVSGNHAAIVNVGGLYQGENGAEENQGVQVDLCSAAFLQEPVCRVAATDRNLCRIARADTSDTGLRGTPQTRETIETVAEERIRL